MLAEVQVLDFVAEEETDDHESEETDDHESEEDTEE